MMGRKAKEIRRLCAELDVSRNLNDRTHKEYAAKLYTSEKRAEAAEAKLKAVRKALGILDPWTGSGSVTNNILSASTVAASPFTWTYRGSGNTGTGFLPPNT